jgi:hypothetical protein
MSKTSDYWLLTVTERAKVKVLFDQPVTASEAINLYNSGDYEDISDIDTYDSEADEAEPLDIEDE